MNVAIFDYGTGNLHSLQKALEAGGARVWLERDPAAVTRADALVLPGVGAFGAAAQTLDQAGDLLRRAIRAGLPTLGICLGMQLLFDVSEEGAGAGLGVIPGHVRRLRAARLPQMGWNEVVSGGDRLFAGAAPLVAYYANSYVTEPAARQSVVAWSQYGADRFPAAVRAGRTLGVQFHPEKSGAPGLRLLANFLAEART